MVATRGDEAAEGTMEEAETSTQRMQGAVAPGMEAIAEMAVADESHELQFCEKRALFGMAAKHRGTSSKAAAKRAETEKARECGQPRRMRNGEVGEPRQRLKNRGLSSWGKSC